MQQPLIDEGFSSQLLGKVVLVGKTYIDSGNKILRLEQFVGRVIRVNANEGIILRLDSGIEEKLPPDFRSFRKALPGEYKLQSTNKIVRDPDYMCTWIVESPN